MTSNQSPRIKLRALVLVVGVMFAVSVTGGYLTAAFMSDSESVPMRFEVVGNTGNANAGGNANAINPVGMDTQGPSDGAEAPSEDHGQELNRMALLTSASVAVRADSGARRFQA